MAKIRKRSAAAWDGALLTLEWIRLSALLLAAFVPSTCEKMWSQLGMEENLWEQNIREERKVGRSQARKESGQTHSSIPRLDPAKILQGT